MEANDGVVQERYLSSPRVGYVSANNTLVSGVHCIGRPDTISPWIWTGFNLAMVQTTVGAKLFRRSALSTFRYVACSANAIVSAYHLKCQCTSLMDLVVFADRFFELTN
jgi:hypothetical protein